MIVVWYKTPLQVAIGCYCIDCIEGDLKRSGALGVATAVHPIAASWKAS